CLIVLPYACHLCNYLLAAAIVTFSPFHDAVPAELYTLSLHDALPILSPGRATAYPVSWAGSRVLWRVRTSTPDCRSTRDPAQLTDRKSTRLNSSHQIISYAVFCLKKKKNTIKLNTSSSRANDSIINMR